LKITLLTVGQKMPDWINAGYHEYAKRLRGDVLIELVELPLQGKSKKMDATTSKRREAELILAAIPVQAEVVALDEGGPCWSTMELSTKLERWKSGARDVCLLVGGPDGLHQTCLERATQTWSLSKLTFPHPLVRVIVAEQLYRAQSILMNHPYHRA